MECFKVEALSFTYPNAAEPALKNVSFSVGTGDFVTICGLSGSGKSTLLRQLKPLISPHGKKEGRIFFEGQPIEELDRRSQIQRIGFVMQSPDNQSVTDKVWHELSFGLESIGLDTSGIQRRTAETAAFFGIESWFERSVDELSGGQKQILNLASAVIMQPSVLILDEPAAQLDPIAAEKFISLLKKINSVLGTTVIISEHELDGLMDASTRLIVMSGGSIISDTEPKKVAKKLFDMKEPTFLSLPSPTRIYAYLDKAGDDCPLSAADGRKWLGKYISDNEFIKQELPEKPMYKDKPCMELKNLWFRYGREQDDILKGLDLKIYRGEFLTILGGNGTGKTTMLSVMSGINKQYMGKVMLNGKVYNGKAPHKAKISVLPQDPQALFLKSTVADDLREIFDGTDVEISEQERRIKEVTELCEIEDLLDRHPYDLSGGEQQKAALAKVLLTEPEILLLDEPSKQLDDAYKYKLAEIIHKLAESGKAVAAVSHDIEFCANYSDRCAMMFNGRIVSCDEPKRFFCGNGIYTTSVCSMSRGIADNCVTTDDILKGFSSRHNDNDIRNKGHRPPKKNVFTERANERREEKSRPKLFFGISMLTLFIITLMQTAGITDIPFLSAHVFISYTVMFISAVLFMLCFKRKGKRILIQTGAHSSKRTAAVLGISVISVLLTVVFGSYFLDDSKYLFISLLVMFESIVPFFVMFEKRDVQARELVLMGVLCALCVSGRALFYMLPEFKPLTAFVIICAAALGGESGFMIGAVSMLVSNIMFGQGIWTPWQMLSMGLIGFLAGALFRRGIIAPSKISLAVFGFAAAYILYGGIMNPASLIMSRTPVNTETLLTVYAFGLPVDTVHALSTALFIYIGAEPIISKLERIKLKYGLVF